MTLNWVLNQKGNDDTVGAGGLLVELNGAPGWGGGCISVAEESVFLLGKHLGEPIGVMAHQAYNLVSNSPETKWWRGEKDKGGDRVKLGNLGEGSMADLCTSLTTFLEMWNYLKRKKRKPDSHLPTPQSKPNQESKIYSPAVV